MGKLHYAISSIVGSALGNGISKKYLKRHLTAKFHPDLVASLAKIRAGRDLSACGSRSRLSQLSPLGGEEIDEFARMNAEHDVGLSERALRHSLRKDDGL
jgi:hypothetical protein